MDVGDGWPEADERLGEVLLTADYGKYNPQGWASACRQNAIGADASEW